MNIATASISCPECGFVFWVPTAFYKMHLKDHENFYCPACDATLRYLEKTGMERCEEAVDKIRQDVETKQRVIQRLKDENAALERRRASQQGATTKLRRKLDKIHKEE